MQFLLGVARPLQNLLQQNQVDDPEFVLYLIDLRSIDLYICFLNVHIARYFKPINLRSDRIISLKSNGNLSLRRLSYDKLKRVHSYGQIELISQLNAKNVRIL